VSVVAAGSPDEICGNTITALEALTSPEDRIHLG
jgi:hypothetical protein